jgi:cell division protease FtsH
MNTRGQLGAGEAATPNLHPARPRSPRRAWLLPAILAALCALAPAASAAPVAVPTPPSVPSPPAGAVQLVGGEGQPAVVSYRTFLGAADAHGIKTALVDASAYWVVGADARGRVVAARIPEPNAGSDFGGESSAKPEPAAAALPNVFDLPARLREDGVTLVGAQAQQATDAREAGGGAMSRVLMLLLWVFGPMVLIVGIMLFLRRRGGMAGLTGRGGRGGAGAHGKIRKGALVEGSPVRFADVAGCDEAVTELEEVVEFLKEPGRFTALGATMPRGVILHGPPGTGKTLLAKATAGEAGVPFFSVSGSEFVDTYVGVGASRVRDLFNKARETGGVVFIDEIDAVGRSRGAGPGGGGNEEREGTLNQILVEMDGMGTSANVVVMAATNRLDMLDKALLRPGRFDRRVRIGLPGRQGRLAILQLHARGKPLADLGDLERLAAITGGAAGADLANILNEAALMAGRVGRTQIALADLSEGQLRHWAGPERAERLLTAEERRWVAVHEAGHCLAAELCPTHAKAQTVTILARGEALGLAFYGDRDRQLYTPQDLRERMIVAMGGRAAEQVCFGRIGAGAANDLEQVNVMARQAIEILGFSPSVGQIVTQVAGSPVPLAESTRRLIDEEVAQMVDDAYREAIRLLLVHRSELDALADTLLEEEQIGRARIEEVLARVSRVERRRLPREVRALPTDRSLAPAAPIPAAAAHPPEPAFTPAPEPLDRRVPRRRTRRPVLAGAASLLVRMMGRRPVRS